MKKINHLVGSMVLMGALVLPNFGCDTELKSPQWTTGRTIKSDYRLENPETGEVTGPVIKADHVIYNEGTDSMYIDVINPKAGKVVETHDGSNAKYLLKQLQ